jgi:cellulose biosynthesis protein BcsQ
MQRAESAGCDVVFIDTPPGRNSEAPAAVEAADIVLVPFWNDQDAYEGVAKTAMLAKRLGKSAVGASPTWIRILTPIRWNTPIQMGLSSSLTDVV